MRKLVVVCLVGSLVGCAVVDGGGAAATSSSSAGGAGEDEGATVASSGGGATDPGSGGAGNGESGAGGSGGAPVEGSFTLSIGELAGCPSARILGPMLPEEAGAIALGRFAPNRLPATIEAFSFLGEPERGQCADMATELVYWVSASATPAETPAGARALPVPSTDGEVIVPLDPPLQLTLEQPYGFVGLRMAAAGDESVCIVACPASERLDDNWWSSAPAAPYGWERLVDSAPGDEPSTPGDGLAWDYVFSVSGTR